MRDEKICNLEFSGLRALMAVRELASFTRVAEHVHLSASAVFCQIRQLEDQLGQKLYERNGKRLRLTRAGEVLAQSAKKILQVHDSAMSTLNTNGFERRELIRIGCGPHGSVEVIPYMLQEMVKQRPHTEIHMISGDDNALLENLREGFLDVVFMSLPNEQTEFEQRRLWSYEPVLVLPPSELGGYAGAKVSDLRAAPFILYRRPMVIDSVYQSLCCDLGFEPNVVMENDETDSIKELIRLGLGISCLPFWNVAIEAALGSLRTLRLPNIRLYNYGLLFRKTSYRSTMLATLLELSSSWKQWWPLANYVSEPVGAPMRRRA